MFEKIEETRKQYESGLITPMEATFRVMTLCLLKMEKETQKMEKSKRELDAIKSMVDAYNKMKGDKIL